MVNANLALLKFRQEIQQGLVNESNALRSLSETKSVTFCNLISTCLKQLSIHVANISESFGNIDGSDVMLLTSLMISQYNVRYGAFLEISEELNRSMYDTDEILAELLLNLGERFQTYGEKLASMEINENNIEVAVEQLMDLLYEELKDRYKLLNSWNAKYSEDVDHAIVAFILKKYCKITRAQARNIKFMLHEYCNRDESLSRESGRIFGCDSRGFADEGSVHSAVTPVPEGMRVSDSTRFTSFSSDRGDNEVSSLSSQQSKEQRKPSIGQRLINSGVDDCIICAGRQLGNSENKNQRIHCTCK